MTTPMPQPLPMEADKRRPWKAIASGVVTFIALVWANLDGRQDFGAITRDEWIGAVVGALVALGTVYGITNPLVPKTTAPRRLEHGQAGALLPILAALILLLLFLWLIGALNPR
jgi:hypothetical protein